MPKDHPTPAGDAQPEKGAEPSAQVCAGARLQETRDVHGLGDLLGNPGRSNL